MTDKIILKPVNEILDNIGKPTPKWKWIWYNFQYH